MIYFKNVPHKEGMISFKTISPHGGNILRTFPLKEGDYFKNIPPKVPPRVGIVLRTFPPRAGISFKNNSPVSQGGELS